MSKKRTTYILDTSAYIQRTTVVIHTPTKDEEKFASSVANSAKAPKLPELAVKLLHQPYDYRKQANPC